MKHPTRRNFLVATGVAVGTQSLTACGGGSSAAEAVTTATTDSNDTEALRVVKTPTPVTAPTVQPPATGLLGASTGAMQLTMIAAVASSAAPFCVGHAFKQGDVPAGSTLSIDGGKVQVTAKNTWADGSLKFAVLAGQASLPGGSATVVPLKKVAATAPAASLGTAALRATSVVAEIGCGSFGTVSWSDTDWDAPFMAWVSGPLMSSWIYRKPVGRDPHLVAWLEVRLFSTGAVEVLPWIENGYLRVAAPTNKSGGYTFSLGGTQRFSGAIDLKHHQRTPLIGGTVLSHWLGADPGVTVRHDSLYFQSSELVPSYGAAVSAASAAVSALVSSYQPLQAGNLNYDGDNMAGTGYQEPIGLLPQHDVLYLVSDVAQAYAAVVRNGFSAGRYSIHYRDETTQRPLRFSKYPTLNIGDNQGFKDNGGSTTNSYTPAVTGGNGPTWDVAHSPSVGYMAYLITGRFYFMEEAQFATTANYLGNGDNSALRNGSKGLVQTCVDCWQTRSCAWDWRARVQALCVTPDDDIDLRAEFLASAEANIEHFHSRYVAQRNNPYGWIMPGEAGYNGTLSLGAPWQQDFVTAAFGHSMGLGLPLSATGASKLAAFFQWKAKSVVSRLGAQGAFWYINADPYLMNISPAAIPDYVTGTGPWYATDADVYNATYASPPAWLGRTEGVLAGEIMPGDRAYWGNLMPAISYAVRYGVVGAQAAYNRITAASNYKALSDAFNSNPVWSVRPSRAVAAVSVPVTSQSLPAWLAGKPVNSWIEIPNSSGAGGAAADAYSGFAFNDTTGEILIAAAGGHNDSSDNRVVSLSLLDNAPTWKTRSMPSASPTLNVAYYNDGRPTSRHLYSSCLYVPQVNRVFLVGVRFAYGAAYTFTKVDGFNLGNNTWDPAGTWSDAPSGHYGACVTPTGDIWTSGLARWAVPANTWSQPITQRTSDTVRWPMALDTLRNQIFTLNWGDGEGSGLPAVNATRVALGGNVQTSIRFNASVALTTFIAEAPTYAAIDYDADNDRFLFYSGQGLAAGRVYVVKPNSTNVWDMSFLTLNSAVLPPPTPASGIHNRFQYVSALKGFVLMPSVSSNLFFIRLSAAT